MWNIKNEIFTSEDVTRLLPLYSALKLSMNIHDVLECYNGKYQEVEYLRNLKVSKTKGECTIEGHELGFVDYAKRLKTCKVNINTKENPKFTNIRDYWNEESLEKVVDLLHEYHDLFSTTFLEMNGIVGELWKMRIPLKPYVKLVK